MAEKRIAVVIPCYKVKAKIADVVRGIGPEVSWIICVDDACPEKSGEHVRAEVRDPPLERAHPAPQPARLRRNPRCRRIQAPLNWCRRSWCP